MLRTALIRHQKLTIIENVTIRTNRLNTPFGNLHYWKLQEFPRLLKYFGKVLAIRQPIIQKDTVHLEQPKFSANETAPPTSQQIYCPINPLSICCWIQQFSPHSIKCIAMGWNSPVRTSLKGNFHIIHNAVEDLLTSILHDFPIHRIDKQPVIRDRNGNMQTKCT